MVLDRKYCNLQIKLDVVLAQQKNRTPKKHSKKAEKKEEKRGLLPRKSSSRRGKTLIYEKIRFLLKKPKNRKHGPYCTGWLVKTHGFRSIFHVFLVKKRAILEPIWAPKSRLMLPKPQFLQCFSQIFEVLLFELKNEHYVKNVQSSCVRIHRSCPQNTAKDKNDCLSQTSNII